MLVIRLLMPHLSSDQDSFNATVSIEFTFEQAHFDVLFSDP